MVCQVRGRNIDERAAKIVGQYGWVVSMKIWKGRVFLRPTELVLISIYRTEFTELWNRGIDIRQQAIDHKLAKYGITNCYTAFGVQVALAIAREKANAYTEMELIS